MSDDQESLVSAPTPLTYSELEDELHKAADKAQFAAEDAFASRLVVSNLLLALHDTKVLNGHAFLSTLRKTVQAQAPDVLQSADRRAVLDMLEELQRLLLASPGGPDVH
jgi:hypothetical protein